MTFTANSAGLEAIHNYLPARGTPQPLQSSSVNNPDSSSAGTLGGQVVAMGLNILYDANILQAQKVGDIIYCPPTPNQLSGLSVLQIWQKANTFMGGDAVTGAGSTLGASQWTDLLSGIIDIFHVADGSSQCPDASSPSVPAFQAEACTNLPAPGSDVSSVPIGLAAGGGALLVLSSVGGAVYCRRRRRSATVKPQVVNDIEAHDIEAHEPDVVVMHSASSAAA